jgi:hypothetical protein
MTYVLPPITLVLGLVVGYLLSQKVESRKNQKEVSTEIEKLLTRYWAWYGPIPDKLTDAEKSAIDRGDINTWLPRLRDRKLAEEIEQITMDLFSITAASSQMTTDEGVARMGELAGVYQRIKAVRLKLARHYH